MLPRWVVVRRKLLKRPFVRIEEGFAKGFGEERGGSIDLTLELDSNELAECFCGISNVCVTLFRKLAAGNSISDRQAKSSAPPTQSA